MKGFRKARAEKNPNPISDTYKLPGNLTFDVCSLHTNQKGKVWDLIQTHRHHYVIYRWTHESSEEAIQENSTVGSWRIKLGMFSLSAVTEEELVLVFGSDLSI